MSDDDTPPIGAFCWVDLATPDTDAAQRFYRGLFGWHYSTISTDRGPPYQMLLHEGAKVAGLFRLAPDMAPLPVWQSYLAVEDLERSVERALDARGELVMPPMDVMDAGRMAFVQDPTGATVGLWQARGHRGEELSNRPGARCWNELQTRSPDAAVTFYGALLGWGVRTSNSYRNGLYRVFHQAGRDVAGLNVIEDDWGPVPPNWQVYFGVDDCDAAILRAIALGGRQRFSTVDVPGVGRFAMLSDPQGAELAIIELAADHARKGG